MVGSVTGHTPYSYYNVLNPPVAATPVPPPANAPVTPAPAVPAPIVTNVAPAISGLLTKPLSSDVISLLQEFGGSTNGGSLSALFGSGTSSGGDKNVLGDALTTLLTGASQLAAFKKKVAEVDSPAPQSALAGYLKAVNAYSDAASAAQTKAVIDANSFQADGKTKLVL